MKKFFSVLLSLLFVGSSNTNAQTIVYNFKTPADKTNATMEKIKAFKLDADKEQKVKAVFTEFYGSQQKMLDAAIANGVGDPEVYKAKKLKLAADRDVKLKALLTPAQFKTWTDEIEPSLKPQRPKQ